MGVRLLTGLHGRKEVPLLTEQQIPDRQVRRLKSSSQATRQPSVVQSIRAGRKQRNGGRTGGDSDGGVRGGDSSSASAFSSLKGMVPVTRDNALNRPANDQPATSPSSLSSSSDSPLLPSSLYSFEDFDSSDEEAFMQSVFGSDDEEAEGGRSNKRTTKYLRVIRNEFQSSNG